MATIKLIGDAPNQVSRNKDLGSLAYQDAESIAGDVNIGGTINDSIKIDTNGNVGIGTVEPNSLLELYSDNPRITLSDLGTQAKITNLSGNLYYDTSSANRDHIFEGAGIEAARITGDGNVGIGIFAPVTKLDVNGAIRASTGILFGTDTAAANTLDDYEEGTWLPNLGGTTTYNNQTASYVKIGKLVYIRGQVHVNLIGTGSQSTISGLPFSAKTGTNDTIAVSFFGTMATNVYWFSFYTNLTTLGNRAQENLDGTVSSNINLFQNGTQILFSGCYEVN